MNGSGGAPDGGGSDEVSTTEKVIMVASAAFTLALFGVATWYALTGPGVVDPTVQVAGSHAGPGGDVVFTVRLVNSGDVGLVSATVEAGCTEPPAEIVFENVPAAGRRTGTVVCPAGTDDPSVSVSSWIPE